MSPTFCTALFDFDGTLADTSEGVLKGVQNGLRVLYGEEHPLSELGSYMGPPLAVSFAAHGYPERDLPRFLQLYAERYRELGRFELKFYPGAVETLRELKAAGVRLAVASSKTETVIEGILSRFDLDGCFDAVSGATDPGDPLTKQVAIERALSRLGFEGDRGGAVMVGDRYLDAVGAEKCGLAFVAALFGGFGPREEFAGHRVDLFADSFPEIGDFILGRN